MTRELRLALAMRGGVSLAVWIGGACAEIETLRRGDPATDQLPVPGGHDPVPEESEAAAAVAAAGSFWRPLLGAAGLGPVRVDVVSGASAGGLNGALLAASLKYGVEFDLFRDIWLEVGDIRRLLRSPHDPQPRSVLRGDDYFLTQLRERLDLLVSGRTPNDGYLDVTLTATIADPLAVTMADDLGGGMAEPSHRATFRFRHNAGTTDFHRKPTDQRAANRGMIAKLALAARSTASFPGAFEPATVPVERSTQVGQRSGWQDGDRNLFGQFSDASQTCYRVIDGGVLDNIPITRAIHAVAMAPTDVPTYRYLLYLDPSPQTSVVAGDREFDMLGTLLSAKSALGTAESILDDLEELRRHNDLAARYEALQMGLTGDLDPAQAVRTATGVLGATWRQRSRLTARRIRNLLEDPVRALGEDPFTSEQQRWPLGRDHQADGGAVRGSPLDRGDLDTLECWLRSSLARRRPAALDDEAIRRLGPGALASLSLALLEVVQDRIEPTADPDVASEHADQDVKARLYDALWLSMLLVHTLELFWPVHTAASPPPRDAAGLRQWAGTALQQAEETLTWLTQELGGQGQHDHPPAGVEALRPLADEIVRRHRTAIDREQARGGAGRRYRDRALLDGLWAELQDCALTCGSCVPPSNGGDREEPDCEEHGEEHAPLADLLRGADTATIGPRLLAYEVITQPLQSLSPRPPLPMRFVRLSGAQGSPAADELFSRTLTPRDKLAGNELANFAAFYKASWRASDWMWGRLDAAAALVNLLLQPSELVAHFRRDLVHDPVSRTDELAASFERAVTTIGDRSPLRRSEVDTAAWQKEFASLWASRSSEIRDELTQLFRGGSTALNVTRWTLTRRRQLEILAREVPTVVHAAIGDQLEVGNRALTEAARHETLLTAELRRRTPVRHVARTPADLSGFLRGYRVGEETIGDEIGRHQFTELVANLGVATWRAATWRSATRSRKVPALLRPIGLLLHALRIVALGVVRLPRWSLVATPLIAALAAWVALRDETVLGVLDRSTAVIVLLALAIFWGLGIAGALRAPWRTFRGSIRTLRMRRRRDETP
ncbi:MAG: patatin-like protein [Actinomycetota bacterium]|nr:patatin-like protein [Actinomycetota bacterium]